MSQTPDQFKNAIMKEGAPVVLKGGHRRKLLALCFYGLLIAIPVAALWWGGHTMTSRTKSTQTAAAPSGTPGQPTTKPLPPKGPTLIPPTQEPQIALAWIGQDRAGVVIDDQIYTMATGDSVAGCTLGATGMQWADLATGRTVRRLWLPEPTLSASARTQRPGSPLRSLYRVDAPGTTRRSP